MRATWLEMQHPASPLLSAAIAYLAASLDPQLWLDETHLAGANARKVFIQQALSVLKLNHLADRAENPAAAQLLKPWIGRILNSDRLLATEQIRLGVQAGQPSNQIDRARAQISEGDEAKDQQHYVAALLHYTAAWQRAAPSAPRRHGTERDRPISLRTGTR
jgi:hypothetical protein